MNEINAKKLLFEVADVLEDIGVEFFLYGGTFLGAVRENRFIKIDKDIDLAMLHENLLPVAKDIGNRLIKKGIKIEIIDHRHKKPWDGSIYAIKFYGYGEHGDLVGYAKIKGKRAVPSHIDDHWLVHTARFLEELSEIEFYGRIFKGPKNADGFLTEKYGDWHTLHKKFHNISKPTCRKSESWMDDVNLPDFMIIGVPRCGTSSLFLNLAGHPKIQKPLTRPLLYSRPGTGLENKELGFFPRLPRYKRGIEWYSTLFPPKKSGYLTFEASTYCGYFPKRVKSILPEVKSILLVRNPTKRAWSQLLFKYREQSPETLSATHPAVKGGIYIDIVKNWHKHFPKKRLLILKSEDWFLNPREVLKQIYEFLEIEEVYPDKILFADTWIAVKKKYGYPEAPTTIKNWLNNFYRPYNKQLDDYLGRNFGWGDIK